MDPTPGDPVLVLAGGQEYLEVARSIDDAAGAMSRLDVAGTVSQAVDSLMGAKEDTIGEIRRAHARYVAAGDALVGYASALERVQGETLAALDRARDAQDQAASASGSQDRWQELADSAKDETEKQEYQSKADQAGNDADQAAGVISGAKSTIESAVSDRDRAANAAVDRIEEITSSDDLNDGWWDDWGSKLVAAIADIADMISTIAGILAIVVAFIPVVGQALAGVLIVIAAVAAIVSAVANITLAATGERSWAEAGIAIAGAALSLIGLGGAAKAAMGLSKSIAKGAFKGGFKQGMKDAWCKFRFGACFTAGTMIRTADGEKPIEDIQVEDKVWARNVTTGQDELRIVTETYVRRTTALHHLTVAGALLTTTAEHPFMVHERGWTAAADLRPGDLLVTANGPVPVDGIRIEARAETVYNFSVATDHTYYVLADDVAVLVHNSGGYSEPVQNILDALSHGVNSANPIGDGTALAAANNEVLTGQLTNGVDHVASTTQYRNRLVKMRDGVPIGKTRRTAQVIPLTEVDRPAVDGMISAIDDAHAGQYKGKLSAYGIGGCK
ncbi:polymorphic toxin-type HINT domain-containing protein [Promicromonospora sp. MS192]|uniref:polymorphic toxin-type HINT domain-containing protein n=1 Tax=Promicromonospora sp. MS192 TaxID=3412684 RepID=UPI003C2BF377